MSAAARPPTSAKWTTNVASTPDRQELQAAQRGVRGLGSPNRLCKTRRAKPDRLLNCGNFIP
jgi:hypothetical protein